jgi:hypothetical protein
LRRAEIDRRLAAGESTAQVARDYEINLSSLHRHRVNCLRLGSANAIKKEAARGSAAVALLPSKETLSGAFSDLAERIDEIRPSKPTPGSPVTSAVAARKSMLRSKTTSMAMQRRSRSG